MARRYLTVSIPYVNAAPHLGYALELVEADALARAFGQQGDEVRLLGGTDDHAIKNALAAEAAGIPTADFRNENAARFQQLGAPLHITFDDFIRTSADPRHRPGVERLWDLTAANGDFYRSRYEGPYCVGCEQFYAPDDLVDGRCPDHDAPVDWVAEDNWFFRLSRYEDQIREVIESGRLRIVPDVYANEALAVVRSGLADISVSRSVERARRWGIPVPGDPSQVIYVWWEALANYITALGVGDDTSDLYRHWWVDADERIHVIGKGILRFHAIYWPALLLSTGQPLPTTLFVHPYLTANGQKLSKTTGNVVDPIDTVARFGTDRVRWWLLSDVPRAADADYTDERLLARTDDDLANGVGNLAHRVLTMVQRFADGTVTPSAGDEDSAADAFGDFDFRRAVATVQREIDAANEAIESAQPWQLAKRARAGDEPATSALHHALSDLVRRLHRVAFLLEPLVPDTAARLRALLTPDTGGRLPPPTALHARLAEPLRA